MLGGKLLEQKAVAARSRIDALHGARQAAMTYPASLPGPTEQASPRVLVVEDPEPDSPFNEEFVAALRKGGFEVESASGAWDCIDRLTESTALVILGSLGLEMRWMDLCRRIWAVADVPIVVGTPFESEVEAVLAFELGVAGYVTDRRHTRELVARVRAALRPLVPLEPQPSERSGDGRVYAVDDVHIDLDAREVKVRGRRIYFARLEFDLLAALLSPPGIVRTRRNLTETVWGSARHEGSRTLDTHIRRLRLKLETDPSDPRLLVTVRGVGFRFDLGV
jgi:two-component system, OmpR family, response regulator RegX3